MTDHTALRALAEKATPGPWVRDQYGTIKAGNETLRVNGVSLPCGGRPSDYEEVEANSDLITACNHAAILALLDERASCREVMERAAEAFDVMSKHLGRYDQPGYPNELAAICMQEAADLRAKLEELK